MYIIMNSKLIMAKKCDNIAAGDTFPPLPKVNSLQALMRLRPKRGSEWCTFAFVLNRDMLQSDGSLDDLHAVVFPLGAFDDQAKAEEHAKNIISITGHPGVVAARYGAPVPLATKFDPQTVVEVPVDVKGRLIELESAQYKREREQYEQRIKRERDIMKEAEEETDPDNIEHFKRQCYLAIKNRATFQMHSREADSAWQNYKKREMMVRDHFTRHPEHEKQWLPYLKEKLTERGELDLYYGIENAYTELKDELLGLIDSDSADESSPEQPMTPNNSPDDSKLQDKSKLKNTSTNISKSQATSTDISKSQDLSTDISESQARSTYTSESQDKSTDTSESQYKFTDISKLQNKFTDISKLQDKSTDVSESQTTSTDVSESQDKSTDISESQATFTDVSKSRATSTDTSKSQDLFTDVSESQATSTDTSESQDKSTDTSESQDKSTDTSESQARYTDTSESRDKSTDISKSRDKSTDTSESQDRSTDTAKSQNLNPVKDNIECECPGGICLGLKHDANNDKLENMSDDCRGGICFAENKSSVTSISEIADSDDIIAPEELNNDKTNLVNQKDMFEDPGFIDDSSDEENCTME